MKELIQISTNKKGENIVDTRKLHGFLGIRKDFSTWIKARIEKYGFERGIDFSPILGKKTGRRGRAALEYKISTDMAKELAMVENNEKGREARKYFIEVEKAAREMHKKADSPMNQLDAIRMTLDLIERRQSDIDRVKERLDTLEQNANKKEEYVLVAVPKDKVGSFTTDHTYTGGNAVSHGLRFGTMPLNSKLEKRIIKDKLTRAFVEAVVHLKVYHRVNHTALCKEMKTLPIMGIANMVTA